MTRKTRLLLHNVGHHELYAIMKNYDGKLVYILPKNVTLNSFSSKLLRSDEKLLNLCRDDPRILELTEPLTLTASYLRRRFRLNDLQLEDLKNGADLIGIFFPLLPAVMNRWIDRESDQRVLLITSKPNEKSLKGTATYFVGKLNQLILKHICPEISCELLRPIESDPFLFESQVSYIRKTVRTKVNSIRREVVENYGELWVDNFELTISASTGTTPMIIALHAAFRDLRPFFIHAPTARRITDPSKNITVENYNFDTVGDIPAQEVEDLPEDIQALVQETISWEKQFKAVWASPQNNIHELESFWLRKGKKPVLAVLMVENKNGRRFHKACNVEVSLPTGTLCAERNAIGTALANDPGIKRKDIKMISVLSLLTNGDNPQHINPLSPCGACMEWLRKIAEVNPDIKIVTFTDTSCSEVFVRPVI